jgi:hypothetical protein
MTQRSPIPLYVGSRVSRLNIQNGVFGSTKNPVWCSAQQFNVNRLTVSKALNELSQEGMLCSQVGKGTYVSRPKSIRCYKR